MTLTTHPNAVSGTRYKNTLSSALLCVLALVATVLLHSPAVSAATTSSERLCNQHSELCTRAYNDVSAVSTHASFATTDKTRPSVPGTQYKDIKGQLDDGVRGLHFNLTKGSTASSVQLCFPDCSVNNGGELVDTLKTVKSWLDSNTNDVVTIFLEGTSMDASPAYVTNAFTSAGIDKYALKGKPATWPTLGDMIDAGTRLVVFSESAAVASANTKGYFIPYAGNVLRLAGPYNYGAEWQCGPWDRSTETILLIPHYIVQTASYNGKAYTDMPYPFNLGTTNGYQFEYHAVTCRGGQSIWVNFMEVDFYDQGDVFTPTLKMNSLPYTGDDASNFYPKFFDADPDVPGF
ncbi:hypothetical protein GGI11_004453 [Coemansia sp. RSA 2049]|nr:hypothetical protein GGI11_004453 [Coemansia sp. RSA 2049]